MSETTNDTETAVTETSGEETPPEKQPPAKTIDRALRGLLHYQMLRGSDYHNIYGVNEEHKRGDSSKVMEDAIHGTFANLEPKDEIEAMLIGQIIVMHNVAMECMKDAINYNNYTDSYYYRKDDLEIANKCLRSFAMLVETLNRHRGKGQQKVTVEHVHVHPGGQAIVGNVSQGGSKKRGKPHAP